MFRVSKKGKSFRSSLMNGKVGQVQQKNLADYEHVKNCAMERCNG